MAAKELKALVDIGTSLGYTGEDLKQWLNDERIKKTEKRKKRRSVRRKRSGRKKKKAPGRRKKAGF